jgi:hypothetical protein
MIMTYGAHTPKIGFITAEENLNLTQTNHNNLED